jgi:phage baseplate assembly protein W
MSRADRITPTTKRTENYSDFLINFDRNPISGELARSTDERAVIRSIRNLIHTNRGERLYASDIGCSIKKILFEPADPVTTDLLISAIRTTITQHEPRAILKQIDAQINEDQSAYTLNIALALVNSPSDVFSFSTVLKRVR